MKLQADYSSCDEILLLREQDGKLFSADIISCLWITAGCFFLLDNVACQWASLCSPWLIGLISGVTQSHHLWACLLACSR